MTINLAKSLGITLFLSLPPCATFAEATDQPTTTPTTTRFSLAISGGVSLGAYEAGLNWAIVKQMRLERARSANGGNGGFNPQLVSIAGASAGGVNALLTAIDWCMLDGDGAAEISKNVYYENWSKIGLDKLLPEDSGTYEPDDGLFSRAIFSEISNEIVKQLGRKIYRTDCDIPFALTVTRTVPLKENIAGITVRNSHFTLPLRLVSSKVTNNKVVIKNFLVEKDGHKHALLGNIIYLPETNTNSLDGKVVDTQLIKAAATATSAFPIAFGRVLMDYCVQTKGSSEKDPQCPTGYKSDTSFFVDGGVFDNVPLGSAVALAEGKSDGTAPNTNYIYMSPGTRRPSEDMMKKEIDDSEGYGVMQQLGFLTGAIATGMDYELYNSLLNQGWDNPSSNRKLLLTSRFPPLIGNYLSHFGAFLDPAFRDFDYYAGVYDAVNAIARYKCAHKNLRRDKQCIATESKTAYDNLLVESDAKAQWVFRTLADLEHQFSNDANSPWRWLKVKDNGIAEINNLAEVICNQKPDVAQCMRNEREAIIKRIAANPNSKHYLEGVSSQNLYASANSVLAGCSTSPCEEPEFDVFLEMLTKYYNTDEGEGNEAMQSLMNDNRKWYAPFVTRATQRLLLLEKQAKRKDEVSLRGVFGFLAYGAEKLYGDEPTITFNQATTDNFWFRLLPYEISRESVNSEWGFSWEPKIKIDKYWSLNLKLAPYQTEHLKTDAVNYAQIDGFITGNDKSNFISSWGIGPNLGRTYKEYDNFKRFNYGVSGFLGFAGDTIRVTAGVRALSDTYPGEENFIYIGITDIPGLIYWAYRSY